MRAIPDDFLHVPVSISIGNSAGSGFLLNTDTSIYVVTAKHVLHDGTSLHAPVMQCVGRRGSVIAKLEVDLAQAVPVLHQSADVAIVRIGDWDKTKKTTVAQGVRFLNSLPPDFKLLGINTGQCFKFVDVIVGNDVYVFGYPTSLSLAGQLDPARPLLRKGVVADKDSAKDHIVIDCPVYQGNSGGLVLERREVGPATYQAGAIGVASQFVPFVEQFQSMQFPDIVHTTLENSGYSIVVPIDRVLELLP
jgi:hypothetical protein